MKKPIQLGYRDGCDEPSSKRCLVLHPESRRGTRHDPFFNEYREMLQECLDIAGIDDHTSLVAALKKYKVQEAKLKEVVVADEVLKQRQLEVQQSSEIRKKAVERFLGTDRMLESVVSPGRKHKAKP